MALSMLDWRGYFLGNFWKFGFFLLKNLVTLVEAYISISIYGNEREKMNFHWPEATQIFRFQSKFHSLNLARLESLPSRSTTQTDRKVYETIGLHSNEIGIAIV